MDTRLFIDALLYHNRHGAPWRCLPEHFGNWKSIKERYSRWVKSGAFGRILSHLTTHTDTDWLMMDGTIVRAHACAAGAPKKVAGKKIKDLDAQKEGLPAKSIRQATASATASTSL